MAPDADPAGTPGQPADGDAAPPAPNDEEGTGVWDAARAWDDEDNAGDGLGPGRQPDLSTGALGPELEPGVPDAGYYVPEGYEQGVYIPDEYGEVGTYGPGGYGPGNYPPGVGMAEGYPGEAYPVGGYPAGYEPSPPFGPAVGGSRQAAGGRHGGGGGRQGPGPSRRRGGPWPALVVITALAVIAAAAILAVTNNNDNNTAGTGPIVTQAPLTTQTSNPTTSTATTAPTTQSSATTLPPRYNIAFAVPAEPQWEPDLVASWLATERQDGITAADVSGEVPGKVEFAYSPGTDTYWAIAVFQPSATLQAEASTAAGQAKLAAFTNTEYAFSWQDGKDWTLLGDVPTGDCPGVWVPTDVLAAWSMCGLHPSRTPPGSSVTGG